jgi:hypothetical protein
MACEFFLDATFDSFLESRRPSRPEGDSQFVRERVLETAERTFENLQKNIVDNIISAAAGLENGGSYPVAYQALPYNESPRFQNSLNIK